MPHIVIIIDEMADLLLDKRETGRLLLQLAEQGYGVGIHLIVATQMVAPDVLFATLKNSFQTKICFRVACQEDSQFVIEKAGAEKLSKGNFVYKGQTGQSVQKIQ